MRNVKYGKCVRCGKTYDAVPDLTNCECGGILDIVYDYDYIKTVLTKEKLAKRENRSMWRYRELLPVEGLFVALGVAGSAALARKLGAPVENGRIVVDERMQTGIPGLYAAGDCTGGLLQVCKAVYEGALAATEAIKQIRGKK
mgnify:CR=1 FL=1